MDSYYEEGRIPKSEPNNKFKPDDFVKCKNTGKIYEVVSLKYYYYGKYWEYCFASTFDDEVIHPTMKFYEDDYVKIPDCVVEGVKDIKNNNFVSKSKMMNGDSE